MTCFRQWLALSSRNTYYSGFMVFKFNKRSTDHNQAVVKREILREELLRKPWTWPKATERAMYKSYWDLYDQNVVSREKAPWFKSESTRLTKLLITRNRLKAKFGFSKQVANKTKFSSYQLLSRERTNLLTVQSSGKVEISLLSRTYKHQPLTQFHWTRMYCSEECIVQWLFWQPLVMPHRQQLMQ